MTRPLKRLFKGTVTAVATLIIMLALLSIAVRLLLPQADGLQSSLLTHLSETLGVEVKVGSLSVQLRGFTPVLSFTDAELLTAGDSASAAKGDGDGGSGRLLLSAHTLGVDLDLLATVKALRPRIDAISLAGAEVQLLRTQDGNIRVLGLDSMQGNDPQALDFFLREGRFRLLDSWLSWRDQSTEAPNQRLFIEIAVLANQGQAHDLRVRAIAKPSSNGLSKPGVRTDDEQTGQLDILAQLQGQAQHPEHWSGRLYLSADGGNLGMIAESFLPAQLELDSRDFRIESWNQLEQGELAESLTGFEIKRLGLKQLDLKRQELKDERRRHGVRLGNLAGLAHWQQQDQGWRLDLSDLLLPGQRGSAPTSASLRYRRAPRATGATTAPNAHAASPAAKLFAAIGTLQIGPIARAITVIAPDLPDAIVRLSRGRIHGRARNLALHMDLAVEPQATPRHRDGPSSTLEQPQTVADDGAQPALPSTDPLLMEMEQHRAPLVISDWRLSTELENLTIDASSSTSASSNAPTPASNSTPPGTGIPPFSGLDLSLDLGPRGGYASVSSSDAEIDLQPLFARPHRFNRLDGDFAWRMMPAGSIHLWTQALTANTEHLETLTRLSLCLHPSGANPFIDLHTHLRNGSVAALPYWLPVGVMDDRLEDWLEQAVVAGQLESGDLLLRGPLERFPFDDLEGRFILELRTVDGVLDYDIAAQPSDSAPGLSNAEETSRLSWPPLRQVAATLRFENRSLEVDVPSAEILNSQVEAGRVSMPNLWQPTYLEIDARGEGPLADGLHVLATSPLAHRLGGLAATAEVSGDGDIHLQLGVPLNRALPFRYAGELIWDPAPPSDDNGDRSLSIKGTDLQFNQIAGRLRFDETGIDAEGIRTRLGQQALEVDVETLDGGTEDARTEIDLQGRTSVDRLAEHQPSSLWSLASGALDWRLALRLSNRDAAQQRPPIDFTLSSNLQGIELSLPAPIGKAVREQRRLELSGRFQDRWPLPLTLDYGRIGSLLEVDRGPSGAISLQRLAVNLSGQPAALPPSRSIEISGALEQLDLMPWLDWAGKADLDTLQGISANDDLRLLPVRLQAQDLEVDTLQLSDLQAVFTPRPQDAWDIRFSTAETGDSQIRLQATNTDTEPTMQIRLEKLDLAPLAETQNQPSDERATGSRADPRRFGGLDLEVDRLRYGDDLLGQLRIQGQPQPNGLRFERLSLTGPHVDASGSAEWLIDGTDYIKSSLQITAKSSAVGELLRESGFYSALSGAPGELELDLSWPGGPGELSLARARGSMEIEIGSGRMLEMEPGVGRMLGILNTAALGRRLSLDFSDVFNDGFSFDSITGEIAIGSGEAMIRDLNIQAPPADIRITGRTNLVDGLLDQEVEVTPKIGVGLALAGAVAGGPVVGAAVFLADKVTDGAFERLGRYAYKVTGPWRDPVIRRVDTSGSPSVINLFVDDAAPAGSAATGADPEANRGTSRATNSATSSGKRPDAERSAPSTADEPVNPFLDDL